MHAGIGSILLCTVLYTEAPPLAIDAPLTVLDGRWVIVAQLHSGLNMPSVWKMNDHVRLLVLKLTTW